MPSELGIYLDPRDWSRRYGSDFWSATVARWEVTEEGCCLFSRKFAVYEIRCSAGDKTWSVRRRCREWLTLWERVHESMVLKGGVPLPQPPAKTLLTDVSTSFLDQRMAALGTFLHALSMQYNETKAANIGGPLSEFLCAGDAGLDDERGPD